MSRHTQGFASRFSVFSLIGAGVFFAGLGLQVALVRYAHAGPDWSYAAQAVFSIELSYLLNRFLTWRDRSVGFWASAWKFNAQKALMTVINMAAYALLVRVGMEYIVANVLLTAIFTPVNYFAGDLLVFARGARGGAPETTVEARMPEMLPTVSVVIPCKSSERTIRATVESFLNQEYPALAEVILVGDVDDSTWTVLDDINDPRLILIEQERTPGRRDPNVKRDKGITKSKGDVIALADSDIVVDPDWISRAVALINGQGGGLVAGGMRSIHDSFWGRFVDNNVLAAKTPRVPKPYQVTAESFGARGYKPPITANAIFTRAVYDSCPLDVTWAYGYEDYEWFWRLAKSGNKILFSTELTASHHHRRSFRHLVREYRQSAHGCAQFIRAHPDSPLSRKRTMQAFGLPIGALTVLALSALAVIDGYGVLVAGAFAMAAVLVSGREVSRVRSLEGLTYPPAALALGGIYAASIAGSLMRPADARPEAPTWEEPSAESGVLILERPPGADDPAPHHPSSHRHERRSWRQRVSWPLVAILALQSGLSLSLVWSNTAFGDEANYLWGGHLEISHWLHGTPVPSSIDAVYSGSPVIFPPLAAMADSIGGLAGARILSLCFLLLATVLCYRTAKLLFGQRTALLAAALWALSEPCLRLAFSTYDPMSVMFMALAVWLAVEAGHRQRRAELVAASAVALALSSATAYSGLVIDPVVVAAAFAVWLPVVGKKLALSMAAWMAVTTAAVFVAVIIVTHCSAGLMFTVLARGSADHEPMTMVIENVWEYSGLLITLAVAGAVLLVATRSRLRFAAIVLAAAAFAAPFGQIHAQTAWSLDKHLAYGLWAAAMVAGAGIARLLDVIPKIGRISIGIASLVVAVYLAAAGWQTAWQVYHYWPNSSAAIASLRPLLDRTPGRIYVGGWEGLNSIAEYYTPQGRDWERWTNQGLSLGAAPETGQGAVTLYQDRLRTGDYGIVMLTYTTDFSAPRLPGQVLLGTSGNLREQLLNLAAENSQTPGLTALTLALEAPSLHYRLAAFGSLDGTYARGIYAIWQHVSIPQGVQPQHAHLGALSR